MIRVPQGIFTDFPADMRAEIEGAQDMSAGPASIGLPPLNISSGPAVAEGEAGATGSSTTGEFVFKGKKTGWAETARALLPIVIVGGAAWLIVRRW